MESTIQLDDIKTREQDSESDGRAEEKDSVGLSDEAEELRCICAVAATLEGLIHA